MSVLALQHSPVADVLDPVSKRTAGLPRISRGTINDARLVSCGEVRITATIYIVAGAEVQLANSPSTQTGIQVRENDLIPFGHGGFQGEGKSAGDCRLYNFTCNNYHVQLISRAHAHARHVA